MLPKVYLALMNSAPVVARIGNRAYRHASAPQGVAAPYVTWSVPAGETQVVLDRQTDADTFRVNVDCWSASDSGADGIEALAETVRAALEPFAVLVAYVADERDAATQLYRFSFAFDWIMGRDL